MTELPMRAARYGSVQAVAISGELDIATAAATTSELLAHVRAGRPRLLLDMRGLGFLSCDAITGLEEVSRAARKSGGWLWVINASGATRRVLELTGTEAELCAVPTERAMGVSPRTAVLHLAKSGPAKHRGAVAATRKAFALNRSSCRHGHGHRTLEIWRSRALEMLGRVRPRETRDHPRLGSASDSSRSSLLWTAQPQRECVEQSAGTMPGAVRLRR
jgi:anti-anti-sigma factor